MAGKFSILAVFKGRDKISAPVSRMQNNVLKFTRKATRGLRNVNKIANKIGRSILNVAKNVAKIGAASVVAIGAATALALQKTADAADALAKRSRRLAFPIDKLQEWQFVAQQAGMTSESFDKSIEGLAKRMGEARIKTGALYTYLNKGNPALLKQLNGTTSVTKAVELMINAMAKSKDPMERAALANAAFGRQGLKTANIAELGAKKIKQLRKEMSQNGIITKEQAEAAEAYNDSMNSLRLSIQGTIQGALLPLMPKLTEGAKKIRELVIGNRELIQTKLKDFFEKAKDAVIKLVKAVVAFEEKYSVFDKIGKFFVFLKNNIGVIAKIIASVVSLIVVLKVLTGVLMLINLISNTNVIALIIMGIIVAVVALIAAVVFLIKHWDMIVAAVKRVGCAILDAFDGLPLWGKIITMIVTGPIGLLVGAASTVKKNWVPIKNFFTGLWDGVVSGVTKAIDVIKKFLNIAKNITGAVIGSVGGIFGFGKDGKDSDNDTNNDTNITPQVITPSERVAKTINENNNTNSSEVTIRTGQGVEAEVTKGTLGNGLMLASSGAF